MIPNKFRAYLLERGASSTRHSGYTLWDHLAGVHRILQASGAPEHVAVAGLFHSVYGTSSFKTVTIDKGRRPEVQGLIGERAEDLVWAFCHLPRPKLFETSLQSQQLDWLESWTTNDKKTEFWNDLVRLECANLLEQKVLYSFPFLVRHAQEIGMLDRDGFSV